MFGTSCLLLVLPRAVLADDLPIDDRPAALHADDLDRFYLDYGTQVVRWTTARDRAPRNGVSTDRSPEPPRRRCGSGPRAC